MRKAISISAVLGIVLAAVLVLFHGWRYGSNAKSVVFLGIAGIVLGAIAAPECEPKAFRFPALWQITFAVVGCLIIALAWDAPPEGYLLAVVGGAVLGYAAPIWIKYVNP